MTTSSVEKPAASSNIEVYKSTLIQLTYSMEQSPSWEADRFSASQEIPCILRKPKICYRINKCPPPVPILSQLDPVHTSTSQFLKIHLNMLSAKLSSPIKSAGASVHSTTGSRVLRISGSNAAYTIFRGSVKGTGCPLHSPASPLLPLPCVTVYQHISTGIYT